MLKSLEQINNTKVIKLPSADEQWLFYLGATNEANYNVEHLKALKELSKKSVLDYVRRTLVVLDEIHQHEPLPSKILMFVEETLKWSEVAKCGYKKIRKEWQKKGYDLRVHNLGSYSIYKENKDYDEIVAALIKTHGLIGQYIRGEVSLSANHGLLTLVNRKLINIQDLKQVLLVLNRCIIAGVSPDLYQDIKPEIESAIELIISNQINADDFASPDYIIQRFKKLRKTSFNDDFDELKILLINEEPIKNLIASVFEKFELWYFEAALGHFSLSEVLKILMLVGKDNNKCKHLTFEKIMQTIYLDYNGKKTINIYKARIIETYLGTISFQAILDNNIIKNPHISYVLQKVGDTIIFDFVFSKPANKLIDFCEAAYDQSGLYSKAVFLLYDLFGFRRDTYDRFYNEVDYLNTMNASLMHKAVLAEYIVGNNVLDIGPGGGALMDLILEKYPNLNVMGIDISQNVIDELGKKQKLEKRKWHVIKGDALHLNNYFKPGEVDTIIYSSIIHELFSYIETDGQKFNYETIKQAIKSAYDVLPVGGRIIIRDGVMSESIDALRIIKFYNPDDLEFLRRYCHDFEGREITYELIAEDSVKMKINDAMEFLYTYTWGEKSYPLEVKEQFGYFTPNEYLEFIKDIFAHQCKIVECQYFLQNGYEENLLNRIAIFDENENVVSLPNSTIIIVVQKS